MKPVQSSQPHLDYSLDQMDIFQAIRFGSLDGSGSKKNRGISNGRLGSFYSLQKPQTARSQEEAPLKKIQQKFPARKSGPFQSLGRILVGWFRAMTSLPIFKALKLSEGFAQAHMTKLDPSCEVIHKRNLAREFLGKGNCNEAIRLLSQCRYVQTIQLGKNHPDTLITVELLGVAYDYAGLPRLAHLLWEDTSERRWMNDMGFLEKI